MTVHSGIFRGTQAETNELLDALNRNCACEKTADGVTLTTCEPHLLVLGDQRALDRLLFARRIADRLRAEEHDPARSPLREETL